jgi:hypothetical protein
MTEEIHAVFTAHGPGTLAAGMQTKAVFGLERNMKNL